MKLRLASACLQIHFDDCDSDRDVWVDADSRSIFPCGWCEKINHPLEAPPDFLGSIPAETSAIPASPGKESPGIDTPLDVSVGKVKPPNGSGSPSSTRYRNTGNGSARKLVKKSVLSSPPQTSTSTSSPRETGSTSSHSVSPQQKTVKLSPATGEKW